MTSRPNRVRSFALDARQAKRAEAISIGIDANYISSFVERFYARVRGDELLGPIFGERIADWPAHLEQMKRFWRSVLHNSGEFNGSPMRKHVAIDGLEERHFRRWLALFHDTLRDGEVHAEATSHVGTRARTIAESLLTGVKLHRHGLAGSRIGKEVFDV
ncbi:group III truncated hemoglobin [Sphingomonas sp. G124]|jgi:hemoglobin|uniref:Group III truncated hemoglobin n=1 Tax=Sphingomonas cremea TaxID=2904799 RepID=A0A9X1TZ55_9SPHN|nr:group III truncated hemoglobin [Sphingomonas cremea]MCF2515813.1 group III truncated hemoglobin [Sphingomonas cremea]